MPVCGWLIDAAGHQFPLEQNQSLRVGRDVANNVVLSDVSVSRTHAEVVFQGGMACIRDLDSFNGTFVDGTRVTKCVLSDGQGVRIGSVGFTYRSATLPQQQTVLTVPPSYKELGNGREIPGNVTHLSFCSKCGARLSAGHACPSLPESSRMVATGRHQTASSAIAQVGCADEMAGQRAETIHVPARCSRTQRPLLFKMKRTAKSEYLVEAATPLEEARLRNPAFTSETIQGRIRFRKDYPGCPHCKGNSAFVCSCGNIACRSTDWLRNLIPLLGIVACPWCGRKVLIKPVKSVKGLTFHAGAD